MKKLLEGGGHQWAMVRAERGMPIRVFSITTMIKDEINGHKDRLGSEGYLEPNK